MNKQETQDQVKRITDSAEFKNSPRLKDFLNYVVEEALAGRSDRIKGLTIAQDVFSKGKEFDPENNSIVRVEAGRLRRRLEQYYSTTGKLDPLIVSIPKGHYAPAFSNNPKLHSRDGQPPSDHLSGNTTNFRWFMAGAVSVAIIILLAWQISGVLDAPDGESVSGETSSYQQSDSELEILFKQALILLIPPESNSRIETARQMFQNIIDVEPDFAEGYAGKSLSYSLAVLFLKSPDFNQDLFEAETLARRAIEANPNFSLSHAALALAQSLDSKPNQALENAQKAIGVSQHVAFTDAMVSIVLLNSGMPQMAIDQLTEALRLQPDEPRTPYLNLLGIAQYVIGDYDSTLESFEKNLARNGPSGPHMDVFVAATYAQLGRNFQAQAILSNLNETNPDYPVEQWMARYIKSEDELQESMDLLQSIGFPSLR